MPNYKGGSSKRNNRSPDPPPQHWVGERKARKTYLLTEYAVDMIDRLGGSSFLEKYTRKVGSLLAESEEDCY